MMHGFHPELGSNRGRQALQFGLGTAVIRFLKRGGNVEPAFEIGIDGLTLRRSNIGSLSGPRERTKTMSLSEMIFRRIEIKNFLIALPCRLIRDVPAEFVGINETTRSNGGVDNPWKQLVCNTTGQSSGFMPLVDTRIGQPRECALSALFRFRFPEIEWNNGGDAGIERSSDRSHWTASRNCPQQDDLFRIDIATGDQQIHATHDVPDPPLNHAFADEGELHIGNGEQVMAVAIPRISLKAFPVPDLIHDQDGASGSCP